MPIHRSSRRYSNITIIKKRMFNRIQNKLVTISLSIFCTFQMMLIKRNKINRNRMNFPTKVVNNLTSTMSSRVNTMNSKIESTNSRINSMKTKFRETSRKCLAKGLIRCLVRNSVGKCRIRMVRW